MNPYDDWNNNKLHAHYYNIKNGDMSTTAVTVTLTTTGWYQVTADEDFVVTGPFSTVAPAALSTGSFFWGDERPTIYSQAGQSLSIVRGSATTGTYRVNKLQGARLPGVYSNQCLDFDGSNDCLTMGNVLNREHTDKFSMTWWARTSSAAAQVPVGKQDGASPFRGYVVYCAPATSTLSIYMINAGGSNYLQKNWPIGTINDGKWHQYAMTYDGSCTAAGLKVYYNGSEVSGTMAVSTLTATMTHSVPFMVGGRYNTAAPDSPWYGRIDDVGVWNCELSTGDITSIYNSGNPADLSAHACAANLEGYWKMGDGDTYPTITDHGTGGNDGTMTNMLVNDIVSRY